MNILKPALKQIFPDKPKDTNIYIIPGVYDLMGKWGINEAIIKDVIRYGTPSKKHEHFIYKFYNGWGVSIKAKYNPLTKCYIVTFVKKFRK